MMWTPSLMELAASVSDPEKNAEVASRLGARGQRELLSKAAGLSLSVDRLFVRAFTSCASDDLLRALEDVSSVIEELHGGLISARLWVGGGETVALDIILSVISDVEDVVKRIVEPRGEAVNEAVRRLDEARDELEGLLGFLKGVSATERPASLSDVVALVKRFIPSKGELASYLAVIDVLRGLSGGRGFHGVLAELISLWFLKSRRASRGCVGLTDIRAWASDVLRIELTPKDLGRAVKALEERRDVIEAGSKGGPLVLRPREEDAKRAFDLAKERYRTTGLGVSAQLLSQHFGWCVEYASALIDELVGRGWLFPGPSKPIPWQEEYYPPPGDEY